MFRNPLADGLVILVIVLLFFAPKRLPGLGRGIGEGIKEFKDGISAPPEGQDQAQLTSETGESTPAKTGSEHTS